jgi:hypothetical protein
MHGLKIKVMDNYFSTFKSDATMGADACNYRDIFLNMTPADIANLSQDHSIKVVLPIVSSYICKKFLDIIRLRMNDSQACKSWLRQLGIDASKLTNYQDIKKARYYISTNATLKDPVERFFKESFAETITQTLEFVIEQVQPTCPSEYLFAKAPFLLYDMKED